MSRVLEPQVYLEVLEDALHDAVTQRARTEAVLRATEAERDRLVDELARARAGAVDPDEP